MVGTVGTLIQVVGAKRSNAPNNTRQAGAPIALQVVIFSVYLTAQSRFSSV